MAFPGAAQDGDRKQIVISAMLKPLFITDLL
jgi:hypothetical protein